MVAHLTTKSVSLSLVAGAVMLDAVVDVKLDGRLALQVCAAPDANCALDATVTGAPVHARVEPSVVKCAPKMPITDFKLTVDPAKTQLVLSDCLYDGLLNTAYSWFQGYLVQTLSTKIGDAVKEKRAASPRWRPRCRGARTARAATAPPARCWSPTACPWAS